MRHWPILGLALGLGCTLTVREQDLFMARKGRPLPARVLRQDVEISRPGGEMLRGWHLSVPGSRGVLVHFYGNGQTVWQAGPWLHRLADTYGMDVVCVDYRGYGFSDGKPSLAALREDALAVFDLAVARAGGRPVLISGYSLGSLAACHAAASRPARGLMLVAGASAFDDVLPTWRQRAPWLVRPFVQVQADPILQSRPQPFEEVATVKAPTLVVHGTVDDVLPYTCGEHFFAASPAGWKRLVRLEGVGHENVDVMGAKVKPEAEAWLAACLSNP